MLLCEKLYNCVQIKKNFFERADSNPEGYKENVIRTIIDKEE
jgi:hypothetical protein